jgi:hypothetical protein
MVGGHSFSRGHLYRVLSNPLYAGEIDHKGKRFPGQHPAIIARETWDAVQEQLARNGHERLVKAHAKEPSLLSGLLYDSDGERLVATHAVKQGKRYRYYVSARALEHRRQADVRRAPAESGGTGGACRAWRLPAAEIEALVMGRLLAALRDKSRLLDQVLPPCGTVAERQALLNRAGDLSNRLEVGDARKKRGLLLALVARVVLEGEHLVIMIRASVMLGGVPYVGGSNTTEPLDLVEIRAP